MAQAQTQTSTPPAHRNEPRTPISVAAGLKPQLAETLPKHIDPDAFARIVQTALQVQPELLDCTPRSLMIACMKAATDGLILDGREAALIVRNVKIATKGKYGAKEDAWEKQATYQPMVQGLMKLARNSGEIVSIVSHVVYRNDNFRYVLGDDERIEHAPAPFDVEPGDPIAVYAIVKLKDGTAVREVMRGSAVMNIAAQGKNAYQYNPGEGKNFAEWWRKTAIRRITKYIPRSSDAVNNFTSAAERIDEDFDFAGEVARPASQPATKKRGGAAAALKDVTPKPPAQAAPQEPGEDADADDGRFAPPYDPYTGEIIDGSPAPGDDI